MQYDRTTAMMPRSSFLHQHQPPSQSEAACADDALLQQQIRDVLLLDHSPSSSLQVEQIQATMMRQAHAQSHGDHTSEVLATSSRGAGSPMQQTLQQAFEQHSAPQRYAALHSASSAAYASSGALVPVNPGALAFAHSAAAAASASPPVAAVSSIGSIDLDASRSVAAVDAQLAALHESLRRFKFARMGQAMEFRAALPEADHAVSLAAPFHPRLRGQRQPQLHGQQHQARLLPPQQQQQHPAPSWPSASAVSSLSPEYPPSGLGATASSAYDAHGTSRQQYAAFDYSLSQKQTHAASDYSRPLHAPSYSNSLAHHVAHGYALPPHAAGYGDSLALPAQDRAASTASISVIHSPADTLTRPLHPQHPQLHPPQPQPHPQPHPPVVRHPTPPLSLDQQWMQQQALSQQYAQLLSPSNALGASAPHSNATAGNVHMHLTRPDSGHRSARAAAVR